jgi:hypothetical protein
VQKNIIAQKFTYEIITYTIFPMYILNATPHSWVTSHAGQPDPITEAQLVILRPGSASAPTLAFEERGVDGRTLWRTVLATRENAKWHQCYSNHTLHSRFIGAILSRVVICD